MDNSIKQFSDVVRGSTQSSPVVEMPSLPLEYNFDERLRIFEEMSLPFPKRDNFGSDVDYRAACNHYWHYHPLRKSNFKADFHHEVAEANFDFEWFLFSKNVVLRYRLQGEMPYSIPKRLCGRTQKNKKGEEFFIQYPYTSVFSSLDEDPDKVIVEDICLGADERKNHRFTLAQFEGIFQDLRHLLVPRIRNPRKVKMSMRWFVMPMCYRVLAQIQSELNGYDDEFFVKFNEDVQRIETEKASKSCVEDVIEALDTPQVEKMDCSESVCPSPPPPSPDCNRPLSPAMPLVDVGEILYARIAHLPCPGKIVGMLLELSYPEVHKCLEDMCYFFSRVEEAYFVLQRDCPEYIKLPPMPKAPFVSEVENALPVRMRPTHCAVCHTESYLHFCPLCAMEERECMLRRVRPNQFGVKDSHCVKEGDYLLKGGACGPLRRDCYQEDEDLISPFVEEEPELLFFDDEDLELLEVLSDYDSELDVITEDEDEIEALFNDPLIAEISFSDDEEDIEEEEEEEELPRGEVQGDSGGAPVEEAASVTSHANITFVDERAIETGQVPTGAAVISRDPNGDMAENAWVLQKLLEREMFIDNTLFEAKHNVGEVIKDIYLPSSLLQMKNSQTASLKAFAYLRSSIEVRVQLNGTKFHCGRVLVCVRPPYWQSDADFVPWENYVNYEHRFLDASVSNSVVITIPFSHALSHFPLNSAVKMQDNGMCTIGTVKIVIFNKLRVAEGASQSLPLLIWARFVNPEIHQTTVPYTDFKTSYGYFASVQGDDEPFQKSFLSGLGKGLSSLIMGGIGYMTGGLATGAISALKGLIFDKPNAPFDGDPVINTSAVAPCHGAGLDHCARLGLTQVSATQTSSALLGSSTADFDIRTLCKIPSFLFTEQWTSSTTSGSLMGFAVIPTWIAEYSRASWYSTYIPSMLAYVSRAFVYWRGSIKYKFQVVSTQFHSGRLLIHFDPTATRKENLSVADVTQYNSVIIDIEEEKEVEFTAPFMSIRPWLRCDHFRNELNYVGSADYPANYVGESHVGFLRVYVLTPLVCPANVSQTVDINVFVYAGDDFELAVPNSLDPLTASYKNIPKYGCDQEYPFTASKTTQRIIVFPNKDYIMATYMAGAQLWSAGRLKEPTGSNPAWYFYLPAEGGWSEDPEVLTWKHDAGRISMYTSQDESPQSRLVKRLPAYKDSIPDSVRGEVQGGEEMITGRDNALPSIRPVEGGSTKEIAPTTMSENAMNLQTVLRRYYPLVNSVPIHNLIGYTMIQIPVTPTLCPIHISPVGDAFGVPNPIHQIAWFARVFTWWRGSLRFMLNYSNAPADIYAFHVPQEAYPFQIVSGVKELDVQRFMSFAGVLSLTHMQGSTLFEVPFFSAYNQLLIDSHNQEQDLRSQNGTVFLFFRNNPENALTFSLFMSTGEDFIMNIIRAPAKIFEPRRYFSDCSESDAKIVKTYYPDCQKNMDNRSWAISTPQRTGFKVLDKKIEPGFCFPKYPPTPPESPVSRPSRGEVQGLFDGFAEERTVVASTASAVQESLVKVDSMTSEFTAVASETRAILKDVKDSSLVDKVNVCVSKMEALLTNLTQTASDINATQSSMPSIIKQYTIVTAEIVSAGCVLVCLRNVFESPSVANFLSLALSFAALLGLSCGAAIKDLVISACNWLIPSADGGLQEVQSGPMDFVEENENVFTAAIAVLGTILYAFVFGVIPSWAEMKKKIKSFFEDDEVTKAKTQGAMFPFDLRAAHFSLMGVSALQKVYEKVFEWAQKLLCWFLDKDNPEVALAKVALDQKAKMMAILEELDELEDEELFVAALKDPLVHNRFYSLVDKTQAILEANMGKGGNSRLFSLASVARKRVSELIKRLQAERPTPTIRYCPFVLCLSGVSGTGKSRIMPHVIKAIQEKLDLPSQNLQYSKGNSDKYWSRYTAQPIVIWDEFANNQKLDEHMGEFMDIVSNNPVQLNMAECADKGRQFQSQVVILGTNVPDQDFNNIRDMSAFKRRRNLVIKMKFREEDLNHGTAGANFMNSVEEGAYPKWEHCSFQEVSNEDTNDVLGEEMDMDECMDLILERISKWDVKQKSIIAQHATPQALPKGIIAVPVDVVSTPSVIDTENTIVEFADAPLQPDQVSVATSFSDPLLAALPAQYRPENELDDLHDFQYIPRGEAQGLSDCVKAFKFMRDEEVPLTTEEEFDRTLFMMQISEDPSFAERMSMRLRSAKSRISKWKNLGKLFFDSATNKIKQFINDHPLISKALGICGIFLGVGLCIAAFAPKSENECEGPYSHMPKSHVATRIKAIEGSYEHGPTTRTAVRVKAATQGCEDNVAQQIREKVHNNVCVAAWLGEKNLTMRALRVGGQITLFPRHFFNIAKEGMRFALWYRNHEIIVEYEASRVREYNSDVDWVLYDCGVRCDASCNVVKYFVREQDLGKAARFSCELASVDMNLCKEVYRGEAKALRKFEYDDTKFGATYSQKGFSYQLNTKKGMCGSPLFAFSPVFPAPGKIMGIHTAGILDKGMGFSVLITYEQISHVFSLFEDQVKEPGVVQGVDLSIPIEQARITPKGDFSLVGVMPNKKCVAQPKKTTFEKTPWFSEALQECTMPKKPAHLNKFINDDLQTISPLQMALNKYGTFTIPFPERNVRKVGNMLINMFQNELTEHTGKRVFSVQEAVNGIEGLPYADRLNLKSSPGWPYQVLNKIDRGKSHFFDDEGNIIDPLLKHNLEERIANAAELQRVPSIWRDCLKDELRPCEKVDQGKTRLFTIAPLDFTIAVRMYFMDFTIAFYSAHNSIFSSVGINPESYEWTQLYDHLREVSDNCVAGDFAGFDGTLDPRLMELVCEVINAWYNDGPENARIRRTLIHEIIHTYQLVENLVYQTHKGNPSGNPLTVIINTIIGFLYMALAWCDITGRSLDEFLRLVRCKHYGDDNLMTVHPSVPEYNFNSIQKYLSQFHIKYTTDKKTDEAAPDYQKLDDVTFLKRGFRRDKEFGNCLVLPVMEPSTLDSFFFWYRKAEEVEEQLNENMRAGLNFAAFHGRKYYDQYHARWTKHMRNSGFKPISISFEEQVDIFQASTELSPVASSDEEICKLRHRAGVTQGLDSFMQVTNSKFARFLCGVVQAPLYYLCAAVGIIHSKDEVVRNDDRWALSIPSGEGKSTLAKKYPHIFVDHDDLLIPEFQSKSVGQLIKEGLPWGPAQARELDLPVHDRRILLVHSPDNTKRQLLGSFITHFPSFIRTNFIQRLRQRDPVRMSFRKRDPIILAMARKVEPQLFVSV